MIIHQEEPVSAPSNVTYDRSVTSYIDRHSRRQAIASNIRHSHLAMLVQKGFNDSDWSFDTMFARPNAIQIGQGDHNPNRTVATHPEIANIVKEDHASDARFVYGFTQKCAHD